jgi:hypothetical protein
MGTSGGRNGKAGMLPGLFIVLILFSLSKHASPDATGLAVKLFAETL